MKIIKNERLLVVALVMILMACNTEQEKKFPESNTSAESKDDMVVFTIAQHELAGIGTTKLETRSVNNPVNLSGVIETEPSGNATLSAPLGGYLITPALLPGQIVKKGEVLARLENPELIRIQQDYIESKARLDYLEVEFKRQQTLREQDVNSEKLYEQVLSEYRAIKGKIAGLTATLKLAGINLATINKGEISSAAVLRSPINGQIKSSNFNLGNYVNPTDVIFEIVDRNTLHLVLDAYEKDVAKIEIGQTIHFGLNNDPVLNRRAQVFLVGASSEEDRIVPIHCHIDPDDIKSLLPGMYVKAVIETDSETSLTIPEKAIVTYQGKPYLIAEKKIDNGYKYDFVPIVQGKTNNGLAAISMPGYTNPEQQRWVTKNAYAIVSAKINSEE